MKTARIEIRKDDDAVLRDAGNAYLKAWGTGQSVSDVLTFSSPAQLFSVLSPRRWTLIERLQGLGAISLRGLARDLGRGVKRVHEDVAILLEWGLIERTEDRKLVVPYSVIHADFNLSVAA